MKRPPLKARLRLGYTVFGVLLALELIEYTVGTSMKGGAWPILVVLAGMAAWPIVYYFMHIRHLWRSDE